MRSYAALAMLLISACTSLPPAGSEQAGGNCRLEGLDQFTGRPGSAENGAAILRESGAKTLRWIAPGSMVTMDYSEQRVNVKLDVQNRIQAITCG